MIVFLDYMIEPKNIAELDTDYDKALYFQNILIARATNEGCDPTEYLYLREYFIKKIESQHLLPKWIKSCRSHDQFWAYIQPALKTYAGRREYIRKEFLQLFEFFEGKSKNKMSVILDDVLTSFTDNSIRDLWSRAIERSSIDPEGGITLARTLVESVCKFILDERNLQYKKDKIELSELYKAVAKELNLSPDQHEEDIFKQILGGCSGVISGLGALRNKFGDAHGKGKHAIRAKSRHAQLSVNLAGGMALFLLQTNNDMK